jgi:glycosyltransferase involved in cell wall biosynthesis
VTIRLLFQGGGNGGDASVVFQLYTQWTQMGHEVTMHAVTGIPDVIMARTQALGLPLTVVAGWADLPNSLLDSADAVHVHTSAEYPVHSLNIAPLQKRVDRERLFCTLHGPKPLGEAVKSWKQKMSAMVSSRAVNRIIVPSQHKVREWSAAMPRIRNITRIANPVAVPREIPRDEARASLGLGEDDRVVSFVGLFRPEKGAMTALEAAAKLNRPETVFLFAGSGPELERCQAFATEKGLNTRFLGYVTDPAPVLRASDLFLFPSTFENFPISLLQAAGAGLSIVASEIPVVCDEFKDEPAVKIFPVSDASAMAAKIDEALSSSAEAGGRHLAQKISSSYSPRAIAQAHLDLFKAPVRAS